MLQKQYEELGEGFPNIKERDAVQKMGISEVELISLEPNNFPLYPDIATVFNWLPYLGKVKAITRNNSAVHERQGTYSKPTINDKVGLVVNPEIDLRLFLVNWKYVYAVNDKGSKSIQFFDKWGEAIHKVYLIPSSNMQSYHKMVAALTNKYNPYPTVEKKIEYDQNKKVDLNIKIEEFQKDWINLHDTHNFHPLLKRHGVPRRQSMELAPEGYTKKLSVKKIEELLETVCAKELQFMVFVGNDACIQIHTGYANRIVRTGQWINIINEEFNFHLKESEVESVWMVRKPTRMGDVHSIEVYDSKGKVIVQFFGKRKPDIPEDTDWRELVNNLSSTEKRNARP